MSEPENTIEIISPQDIQHRVRELAGELSRDLAGSEPIFLGVLKGCFIFLSDLVRRMDLQVQVDFVRLSSYGANDQSSGKVIMEKPPEMDLTGRSVVVVEDIIDTGLTMAWLRENLAQYKPSQLKICVLVDKAERREVEVPVDYIGFKVPKGFLVGYGLDYDECYRGLPGIYEIKT